MVPIWLISPNPEFLHYLLKPYGTICLINIPIIMLSMDTKNHLPNRYRPRLKKNYQEFFFIFWKTVGTETIKRTPNNLLARYEVLKNGTEISFRQYFRKWVFNPKEICTAANIQDTLNKFTGLSELMIKVAFSTSSNHSIRKFN